LLFTAIHSFHSRSLRYRESLNKLQININLQNTKISRRPYKLFLFNKVLHAFQDQVYLFHKVLLR